MSNNDIFNTSYILIVFQNSNLIQCLNNRKILVKRPLNVMCYLIHVHRSLYSILRHKLECVSHFSVCRILVLEIFRLTEQVNRLNSDDQSATSDEHIDSYCGEEEKIKELQPLVSVRNATLSFVSNVWKSSLDGLNCETKNCFKLMIYRGHRPKRRWNFLIVTYKEYVNDYFCLDHQKILCSQCIMTFHRTCTQSTLTKLCKTLCKSDVQKIRDWIEKSIQIANSVKLAI